MILNWKNRMRWMCTALLATSALSFLTTCSNAQDLQLTFSSPVVRPLPKLWIGLMGQPVDETLSAQLGIDHGIVIADVVPDSPAAKAGLQKHDIVLSVQDKPVTKIEDFFEPVEKSEGKPLSLSVIRAGKPLAIEVQPHDRPARDAHELETRQDVLYWTPQGGERIAVVNPGIIVGKNSLPDDVSVTIERRGSQPASIVVKQGEQEWRAAEDKLNELPEHVRPWVQPMLGASGSLHLPAPFGPFKFFNGLYSPPDGGPGSPASPYPTTDINRQLEDLSAQLKELKTQVERLQQTPR